MRATVPQVRNPPAAFEVDPLKDKDPEVSKISDGTLEEGYVVGERRWVALDGPPHGDVSTYGDNA